MPGSEGKSVRAGPKDVRGKTPHEGGKSPSRPPVDHLLLVLGVGRARRASRLPQPLFPPRSYKERPKFPLRAGLSATRPLPRGGGVLAVYLRAVPPFMSLGPTRPWAPGLLCTLSSLFSLFSRRKRKGPFPASVGFLPEPQSVPVHPVQAEVESPTGSVRFQRQGTVGRQTQRLGATLPFPAQSESLESD